MQLKLLVVRVCVCVSQHKKKYIKNQGYIYTCMHIDRDVGRY